MSGKRIYDSLASAFMLEQVTTCFALLGDANMNWAASMAERGCHFVYTRHEHCAVAAAMAYSRSTGEVGVATVTCGPGLTQILTAIPAAVRANIPLIIFAGEAPLSKSWYNQEINQQPFITACGATYIAMHDVNNMQRQVRDAFLRARHIQQPVVLGIPLDLQELPGIAYDAQLRPSRDLLPTCHPPTAPESQIENAVSLINKANKIVVMAGLGAVRSNAADACRKLAEKLDALLATTLPARGLFLDDPYCLGIAGGFSTETARKYLLQADLVIAVGASLAQHNSDSGQLFPASKVLQIDINPAVISQGREAAHHHICSDALLGVNALINALHSIEKQYQTKQQYQTEPQWRSAALSVEIRSTPADSTEFEQQPDLLDPRDVVSLLDDQLPVNWHTVNSSGHCSYFFAQMPKRPVDRFLTIREFGAIGNGLAFAMGVSTANPDEQVVLFDGDGSVMMHVQEFETMARYNMKILIIIMNDGAYGSEIHKLRADGHSDAGAVFGRRDFSAIARGFGLAGVSVNKLELIPAAIEELTSNSGPAILDVHVSDKVVSPVVQRSHAK